MKQNQQKEFLITKFTLDLNGASKPLFFEANSDSISNGVFWGSPCTTPF